MEAHVIGLVLRRRALRAARVHQVVRDLRLSVDGDGLAGKAAEVDTVPRAAERDLDAIMDEPLLVQPRGDARFLERFDGTLFEDAGADPAEHIRAGLALDDQR